MAEYISSSTKVGIGIEASGALGIGAAPAILLPVSPPALTEPTDVIVDTFLRGGLYRDWGSYEGPLRVEGTLEGEADIKQLGYLLAAFLGGSVGKTKLIKGTPTEEPSAYEFSVAGENRGLTVQVEDQLQTRRYIGNKIASLELRMAAGEAAPITFSASLNGMKLRKDLQIDSCDTDPVAWVGATADVTPARDAGDKQEGTASVSLSVAAGFTTGLIAYHNITALDLSKIGFIDIWFKTDTNQDAGAYELLLDEDANCASPDEIMSLPAVLAADGWKRITLRLSEDSTKRNAVVSVGIRTTVADLGVTTIKLDDIRNEYGTAGAIPSDTSEKPLLGWMGHVGVGGTGVITIVAAVAGTDGSVKPNTNNLTDLGTAFGKLIECTVTMEREVQTVYTENRKREPSYIISGPLGITISATIHFDSWTDMERYRDKTQAGNFFLLFSYGSVIGNTPQLTNRALYMRFPNMDFGEAAAEIDLGGVTPALSYSMRAIETVEDSTSRIVEIVIVHDGAITYLS